jgi:hypothetical protein
VGLTLTVFFEDPFWVGLFERASPEGRAMARVVFGAEPSAAEVLAFVLRSRLDALGFVPVAPGAPEPGAGPRSPKRRQREAARAVSHDGRRTRAQEALQAALEQRKVERAEVSRAERRAERERRHLLRQARRKERRRGR